MMRVWRRMGIVGGEVDEIVDLAIKCLVRVRRPALGGHEGRGWGAKRAVPSEGADLPSPMCGLWFCRGG